MNESLQSSKVYVEIVKQLRDMITNNRLKPGDRIPSERELSERLNAGRSSVREALRALELLGLIETRRGEGTFVRDFRGHQLVQLLSTFILQDEKAKYDVAETKYFIEMDCLRLALSRLEKSSLQMLKEKVHHENFSEDEFFYKIVELADNHLFLRIWIILKDYYRSLHMDELPHTKKDYIRLLRGMEEKNLDKTLSAYQKLRNFSFSTDIN